MDLLEQAEDWMAQNVKGCPSADELAMWAGMRFSIHENRLFEEAERLLRLALVAARETVEIGQRNRPPSGWKPRHELDKRADEKEEALVAGMYQEVQILKRLGRIEEALAAARKHFTYLGGKDEILENDVRTLAERVAENGES